MISHKQIKIDVDKTEYCPINQKVKGSIEKQLMAEIENLVNRFDGCVKLTIILEAKGNC